MFSLSGPGEAMNHQCWWVKLFNEYSSMHVHGIEPMEL